VTKDSSMIHHIVIYIIDTFTVQICWHSEVLNIKTVKDSGLVYITHIFARSIYILQTDFLPGYPNEEANHKQIS